MEIHRRGLPSLRVNRVGEEDRDHVHASTAYTADDGANRSGQATVQTSAILHLPRGYRDRSPGHVRSPDGPAHAGCASGGTYGNCTTNRKSRPPSRPEWLRWRQSRPSSMNAVREPFARNTTPNSAPYTTVSCFVSSGHSARDQTIG